MLRYLELHLKLYLFHLLKSQNIISLFQLLGEELWEYLGHNNTIAYESWPKYDPNKLVSDTIFMMVQVNGKLRDKIEVGLNEDEASIKEKALNSDKVKAFTDGLNIVKVIVVPKKIVNIVVK